MCIIVWRSMLDHKKKFNDFLKKELNTEQRKAVKAKNGVFLVVAGAGSGKTRVITARIAHLIVNENVSPKTIVGLTFTNKAANEMRERIKLFLTDKRALPFLGTFHSYCLRILKANAEILKTPFASIMDSEDQKKLLSDLIKRNSLEKKITAKRLSYNISKIKNSLLCKNNNVANYLHSEPLIRDLYSAYEQEKKVSKCLDFDDLLIETAKLFEKNADFKKEFQKKVKHVLVDEYQDTNVVQHILLKSLSLSKKTFVLDSLCIVGDEDQSIYSWRGATVSNIVNFKRDFPQVKTIKIEQNYRSVQPILDAANQLIKNNIKRNPKNLWSDKKARDRIKIMACSSEYQEAEIVSQFLKIAEKKYTLNNVAILYRAHYQSRTIEEALIKRFIPYKIIGGIQFYERKEIKDIIAHLRLAINPFDRISFFRVINCPTRGLGKKFEELFYNKWNIDIFYDFKMVAEKIIKEKATTSVKITSLKNFLDIFTKINTKTQPSDAIEKIIAKTNYIEFLKNSCEKKEADSRIDNIKELISATKHMEQQGVKTIAQFLDEVALMQESLHMASEDQEKHPVTLMTLHAAKGLEFDTVVVVGLEEGILPNSRSLYDDEALEEERRLFYVGITRAKERLLLTLSDYRYAFGQAAYQMESRFIKEMPNNLIVETDCSNLEQQRIENSFCNWLGIKTTAKKRSTILTFGAAKKVKVKWRKNQPVQHKKFGIGVVQKVEERASGKYYLTVKFRVGSKKIDSQFVEKV